jgi:type II secretory pathway pseudopilin PulG
MNKSSGYTLVGVVIAIAILTIMVAAVGPSIAAIMQRDKETELIFRGRQYARGIVAFQKRFGRLPTSLKELSASQPHALRRLWKEPMCNCDDWQLIIAGSPEAAPGQGPGVGTGLGTTPPPGNQPPSTYTGLFFRTPPPSGGSQPTPGGFPSLFGAPAETVGPIIGVRSKVHKRGYQKWRDLEYYDEWRFIAGDADKEMGHYVDPNFLRGRNFTPVPTS